MRRLLRGLAPLTLVMLAACGGEAPGPAASESAAAGEPTATLAASESIEAAPPTDPSVPDAAAPTAGMSQPLACSAEIGAKAAARLAAQCSAVSPATRPPCNAANSCAMIRNEIARSCALIADDASKTPECPADPVSKKAAADMVERYYSAINARDYAAAWALWGEDGGTSGKTLDQFARGFAQTRQTHVDVGLVSDVEGGAGSLYVTVPVTIDAELNDGRHQHFTGSYALRQINRGMGPSQGWHIATASLRAR